MWWKVSQEFYDSHVLVTLHVASAWYSMQPSAVQPWLCFNHERSDQLHPCFSDSNIVSTKNFHTSLLRIAKVTMIHTLHNTVIQSWTSSRLHLTFK